MQEIVPGKTQLGPEIPWEIVGVVADEKVGNLDNRATIPGMYVSQRAEPSIFPGAGGARGHGPFTPHAGARQGGT